MALKDMSKNEKRNFLHLLAIVVCADGKIETQELEQLKEFGKELRVDEEDIHWLLNHTTDLSLEKRDQILKESAGKIKQDSSPQTMYEMLCLLASVAFVDGVMSEQEVEILMSLKDIFGVSQSQYDTIMSGLNIGENHQAQEDKSKKIKDLIEQKKEKFLKRIKKIKEFLL